MKTYLVTYNGNASRFRNFSEEVTADSEREAVEEVYQSKMDCNYFPQEDGSIQDCDGNVIAQMDDDVIEYDGGNFIGQELTYDVVFNDDSNSNNKGFELTEAECINYIHQYNGTNESYFEDYKGGSVSVVCNETQETIYREEVR